MCNETIICCNIFFKCKQVLYVKLIHDICCIYPNLQISLVLVGQDQLGVLLWDLSILKEQVFE